MLFFYLSLDETCSSDTCATPIHEEAQKDFDGRNTSTWNEKILTYKHWNNINHDLRLQKISYDNPGDTCIITIQPQKLILKSYC